MDFQTKVEIAANLATIVGVAAALVVLVFTYRQVKAVRLQISQGAEQLKLQNDQALKDSNIARGQFWLEIEKMFANHNEVHLSLRPGGKWARGKGAPESPQEWALVEDYMGLFEHCEMLLESAVIDQDMFIDLFSYRLRNLVKNSKIVQAKLIENGENWKRFINLCNRCELTIPGVQVDD